MAGLTLPAADIDADGVAYRLAQIALRAPVMHGGIDAWRLADALGLMDLVQAKVRRERDIEKNFEGLRRVAAGLEASL